MKKHLYLGLLALTTISLNAADIGSSSSSSSSNTDAMQIIIDRRAIEAPVHTKGKQREQKITFVQCWLNNQMVAEFDAELLQKSESLKNSLQDLSDFNKSETTDQDLSDATAYLFKDMTIPHIDVLVEALVHNTPNGAQKFVTGLTDDNAAWLTEVADFWMIEHILTSCKERLAKEPEKLKNYNLNNCLDFDVAEIFNQTINKAMFKRLKSATDKKHPLTSILPHPTIAYVSGNRFLIITDAGQLCLYNQRTRAVEEIPIDNQVLIGAHHNTDDNTIFIITGECVKIWDIEKRTTLHELPFNLPEEFDHDVTLSTECFKQNVIITLKGLKRTAVYLWDIKASSVEPISIDLKENESFCSGSFAHHDDKLIMVTSQRLLLYDHKQKTGITEINHNLDTHTQNIASANYLTQANKIAIITESFIDDQMIKRIYIWDPVYEKMEELQLNPSIRVKPLVCTDRQNQILLVTNQLTCVINLTTHETTFRYILFNLNRIRRACHYKDNIWIVACRYRTVLLDTASGTISASIVHQLKKDERVDEIYTHINDGSIILDTNKRLLELYFSYVKALQALDRDQQLFMHTAMPRWNQGKTYMVDTNEKYKLYQSLPISVRRPDLFKVSLLQKIAHAISEKVDELFD